MTCAIPAGVIAVIRAGSAEEATVIGRALARAGVAAIEVTFTVPDAESAIRALATSVAIPIGAGTVRTIAQCEAAADAGASFVVAPDLDVAVVARAHQLGLCAVPGALTPGEVGRCLDAGADAIKIFPAGSVGGPPYIRDLAGPFPGVTWVASGGVTPALIGDYRAAGCRTVCMGRVLIDLEALAMSDESALEAHARHVLAAAN